MVIALLPWLYLMFHRQDYLVIKWIALIICEYILVFIYLRSRSKRDSATNSNQKRGPFW